MKDKLHDVRFWVVVVAALVFLFSMEIANSIPKEQKLLIKETTAGATIEAIFAGLVVIGCSTMLVAVSQHFKQNQK